MKRTLSAAACIAMTLALFWTSDASANKSSVVISAPESAAKGSSITITITVSHNGNNWFHFTDWAYIKVNGTEVERWTFTRGERPESEVFTRQVSVTADGPLSIEAQADCNIHGSAGVVNASVAVK
jgi:desulfoferrodoxin (superoxide reductase-like protein)